MWCDVIGLFSTMLKYTQTEDLCQIITAISFHLGGAWFPLKTFDCSASFRFLRLTFSESWVPLQFCCIRLNHCHLRVSYEPRQPRSVCAVQQRNKSVSIVLMAALLDRNVKKASLSCHLIQWSHFFKTSIVTQLIQSVNLQMCVNHIAVEEKNVCLAEK